MVGRLDVRVMVLIGAIPALLLAFNNCGKLAANHEDASQVNESNDTSLKAFCEANLRTVFDKSYRPVLRDTALCARCHADSGVSPFKFSSNDIAVGFSHFMQVTAAAVDANAVNPMHAPGVTGATLQSKVDGANAIWQPGYAEYQACLGSNVNAPTALRLENQSDLNLYFNGEARVVTLTWDMMSEKVTPSSARFPGIFMVDVNVDYGMSEGVSVPTGYTFRNPQLRMLTGEQEVEVKGVVVFVNDFELQGIENFLSAERIARGIDPSRIYDGAVSVAMPLVSTADVIGIAFSNFSIRPRTDNPPRPATPTLAAGGANRITNQTTVPITVTNDSTARLWCVTGSDVQITSTAMFCPGYEGTTSSGWLTARPTNYQLARLGRTVASGEQVTLRLWIANNDLKINEAPATATFTFDNTPPAAPTLSSVTISDTQVADLNGLADASESVRWCVAEGSGAITNANNCSPFTTQKPTTVGLKGGGTRQVTVFVRDLAGNAAVSAPRSVVNDFGRITFAQLTNNPASGARAVFYNKCFSCHQTGAANAGAWNASDYNNTVGAKNRILNRITATTVNAATGVLTAKEIQLIQLWFSQTTTPVEQ